MPQHHNLSFQPSPRLEQKDQDMQREAQKRDPGGSAYSIPPLTPVDGVLARDRMEYSVWTGAEVARPIASRAKQATAAISPLPGGMLAFVAFSGVARGMPV
jgi:hypothetical protein